MKKRLSISDSLSIGCTCAGKSNYFGDGSECKLYSGYSGDWYNGVWCYADVETCSDAKAHPAGMDMDMDMEPAGYGASRAACLKGICI